MWLQSRAISVRKSWTFAKKYDFPLSRVANACGCAGKSRFCSFDSNYRAVSVRVSHKFRRLPEASDVGGSLYYVCIMNDQPPAGEKNPKYPLSRVENAYFSTDYLFFFVLIPVVLPPSCLPTHPKIFPGLRPARFLIPVFSLIPDPYSRFFAQTTPHPPPIGTWGILWIRE